MNVTLKNVEVVDDYINNSFDYELMSMEELVEFLGKDIPKRGKTSKVFYRKILITKCRTRHTEVVKNACLICEKSLSKLPTKEMKKHKNIGTTLELFGII